MSDEKKQECTQPALKITINGVARDVEADVVSYEDVVAMAEKKGTPTVVWRWRAPDGGMHDGIMHPGCGSVVLHNGMIFNVMHTGNA